MTAAPRTTPRHHVPEDLLVDYVAGRTSEVLSLTVACHLTLCGACQARAQGLEAVGGALLVGLDGVALEPDALDRALARLEHLPEAPAPRPPRTDAGPALAPELALPRALLAYLDVTTSSLPWQAIAPGTSGVQLAVDAPGATALLMRFDGGIEIPFHDHLGPEYITVFSGALEEGADVYRRGDVAVADAGKRHVQYAEKGRPCVALAVNHGPLVPLDPKGEYMRGLPRE